eukprot:TRINITY_DN68060_c0_g1_i1.p1 TRINITY_DN68060_c0_g1~~TRINITY_DN68060_c0_g1_i1.p1  ORF type:complete len:102 (+),score=6.78 TRINITY_DN68060_c0_g1_i1:1289-1594(+)
MEPVFETFKQEPQVEKHVFEDLIQEAPKQQIKKAKKKCCKKAKKTVQIDPIPTEIKEKSPLEIIPDDVPIMMPKKVVSPAVEAKAKQVAEILGGESENYVE